MEKQINKPIQVASEKLILIRFMFDNEVKKIHIEARNEQYNADGIMINTEPVYLLFRDIKYEKAKSFCTQGNIETSIIHMLLKKLEIDRHLVNDTLCDSLPEGVPPYKNE